MMDETSLTAARRDALGTVTFPVGSRHKSFARSVAATPVEALSPKQRAHITRLSWRYRRQMPAHLVPPANPDL